MASNCEQVSTSVAINGGGSAPLLLDGKDGRHNDERADDESIQEDRSCRRPKTALSGGESDQPEVTTWTLPEGGGGDKGESSVEAADPAATTEASEVLEERADSVGDGGELECAAPAPVRDTIGQPAAPGQRKRRHRRGKSKRQRKVKRWKPYNERTWQEKRELEEREARRALRRAAERLAHGQPVAPYNTTQFLMEDHRSANDDSVSAATSTIINNNVVSPLAQRYRHYSTSDEERGDGGGFEEDEQDSGTRHPPDDDDMDVLQQRDFCEVYDSLHAERLGSMSKHELIQEYLYLEDRVEKLESSLGTPQRQSGRLWSGLSTDPTVSQQHDSDQLLDAGVVVADVADDQWDAQSVAKVRIFQREIRKLVAENGQLRRENELLRSRRAGYGRLASPHPAAQHQSDQQDDEQLEGGGGEVRDAADA